MSENILTKNCYIYLNLHSDPKTFSVQVNGIVQKNIIAGIAENARFHVRNGGHAQAVREQVRNVHAFVVCKSYDLRVIEPMYENLKHSLVNIHYHYNDGDFFSVKWNGEWMPLDQDYVFDQVFMDNHKCYMHKTTFWEYLLKRKLTVKEFLEHISPEVTNILIENIKHILKVKRVKYSDKGICANLQNEVYNDLTIKDKPFTSDLEEILDTIFHHCFYSWPKYSGIKDYPIYIGGKNPAHGDAFNQYHNYPKWAGEQGGLRFELLEHMLQVIESDQIVSVN